MLQMYACISGLGFGIGIPIIVTTVYDAVKEWARPSRKRFLSEFEKHGLAVES